MKNYPFYSAITHLKDFYGITMDDETFETIGMSAWENIGNKNVRTYFHRGEVVNGVLELPCNADIIEVISTGSEQYQKTDNVQIDNFSRGYIEDWIEGYKTSHNSLYTPGRMLTYNRVGDSIYLDDKNVNYVFMVYKGVELDEAGLPFINFKEIEAIAGYCAYVDTFKKGMMTKDQATVQLAQMLKAEWGRLCDKARTPEYITQNEMDQIS